MANGLLSGERHRMCLLCLSSDQNELQSIFGDSENLADKIYDCIAVKIKKVPGVPALICQLCRSRVVISHNFVVGCQTANRKYHRLFGSQFRQHRLLTQSVKGVGDDAPRLVVPPKIPCESIANVEAVPAKHAIVQRLMKDDKPQRRHSSSIDPVRKVKPKTETKRRLSAESHLSGYSIRMMAAKIERELANDLDREKCPKCGLFVKNLPTHLLLHSTIVRLVCEICNKVFGKRTSLQYHMNLHTGEKPYKCLDCGKRFNAPSKIWAHRQNNSECAIRYQRRKECRYHCNVCRSAFKHRKLMDQHMSSNHPDCKYQCEVCGQSFPKRRTLYRHRHRVHGPAK